MGPWNRKEKMTTSSFTSEQKRTLKILTLINFLNYIDRDIIFGLVPIIQARFAVSYSQAGLLNTVFSIVHSVCTLPLGWVADRFSRRKVISYGVLFWSLATFLSGLAPVFRSLLLARGLVGVGEAAYAPAATAIITGSFPRRVRARVQGVFDLGMFVGGAIGIALGPVLMGWVGWGPAFFVVGIPGFLLALSILRIEEPRVESPEKRVPIRHILRVPAFVWILMGGLFINFAVYSYVFWGTTFVHTYKGFGVREASIVLGVTVTFAGILGVLTGATAGRPARPSRSLGACPGRRPGFSGVHAAPFLVIPCGKQNPLRDPFLLRELFYDLVPRPADRHHARPHPGTGACHRRGALPFRRTFLCHHLGAVADR